MLIFGIVTKKFSKKKILVNLRFVFLFFLHRYKCSGKDAAELRLTCKLWGDINKRFNLTAEFTFNLFSNFFLLSLCLVLSVCQKVPKNSALGRIIDCIQV